MKLNDNELFIKVLLWAYSRQEKLFEVNELRDALGITDEIYPWFYKVFLEGTNDSPPLIGVAKYEDNRHYYVLSARGIQVVVDYIELSEARKSSTTALRLAIAAIIISIIVGCVQIFVPQDVNVISFIGIS